MLSVVAVASLLAALSWVLFASGDGRRAEPMDRSQGAPSEAGHGGEVDLADVSSPASKVRRALRTQTDPAASDLAAEQVRSESAAPPTLTGRVVDRRTGEPVPFVEIRQKLGAQETMTGMWGTAPRPQPLQQAAPAFASEGDFVDVSKDDGTFILSGVGSAVSVKASFADPDRLNPRVGQEIVLASPYAGDVPIGVGPTVSFDLDGLAPMEGDRVVLTGTVNGIGCTVEAAVRIVTRADGRPWARFDEVVTGFDGDGPWIATYYSGRTRRVGAAVMPLRMGVAPDPVLVQWLELGSARFTFEPAPSDPAVAPARRIGVRIERISEAGGERAPRPLDGPLLGRTRATVWLTTRGRRVDGTADKLLPGLYRWSIGREVHVRTGTFHVAARETTEVTLESLEIPTFDATVTVRCTALQSDVIPTQVLRARSASGQYGHVYAALQPDGEGLWRATFKWLPVGHWSVIGPQGLEYETTPASVTLAPERTSGEFLLSPRGATFEVRIRVRDRETGEDVGSVRAQAVDGAAAHMLRRDGDVLIHPRVPVACAVDVVIAATGYQTRQVRIDAAEVGDEFVVDLDRGTRSRVLVLEEGSSEPIEGVRLRTSAGAVATTDARGVAWVDGPIRGELLEAVTEGSDWIEAGSSFQGDQVPATPAGWYLLLAKRKVSSGGD